MKILIYLIFLNITNTFDVFTTYIHYLYLNDFFKESNPLFNLFPDINMFLAFKLLIIFLFSIWMFIWTLYNKPFFEDILIKRGIKYASIIFLLVWLNNLIWFYYFNT